MMPVDAIPVTPSIIILPIPEDAPAIKPNIIGTIISAICGDNRLVMIKT